MKRFVVIIALIAAFITILTAITQQKWWVSVTKTVSMYLAAPDNYQKLQDKTKEVGQLNNQLQQKDTELNTVKNENQQLTVEVSELADRVNNLEEKVEQLKRDKDQLNNQLQQKDTELNTVRNENQQLTVEVSELADRVNNLEEKRKELTKELDKSQQTISDQEKKIKKLETIICVGGNIEAVVRLWELLGQGNFLNLVVVENQYVIVLNTLALKITHPNWVIEGLRFEMIGAVCSDAQEIMPCVIKMKPAYGQLNSPFWISEKKINIEKGQSYVGIIVQVLPDESYNVISLDQLQEMRQSGIIARGEAEDCYKPVMDMISARVRQEVNYLWGFRVTHKGEFRFIQEF